jgi:outer membrane protein assembly factor BamB
MKHRLLVPAMLAAVAAIGADWTQFRGPDGSGVSSETGLPTSWTSKENVVWRTKLTGPGTSCPIVVGKRVYLTCYSGYGLKPGEGEMDNLMRHLVCLDTDKGAILWTKDFKPTLPESKYQAGNGLVAALDSPNGRRSSRSGRWCRRTRRPGGRPPPRGCAAGGMTP